MKNNSPTQFNKGFTIIESLIAIAILVGAVVGTTTAVQTSLSSAIQSRNWIIASYLAQEGVEQIRNMRDQNRLANSNWLAGIAANSSDPCITPHVCRVSPFETSIAIGCPVSGCLPIRRQQNTGYFGYNGTWLLTPFKRTIRITPIFHGSEVKEIKITVTIEWSKGTNAQTLVVQENLLNW